jgi:hypothetical protein
MQVSILDSLPEEEGGLDCSAPSWVNDIIDHFNYDQVKAIEEHELDLKQGCSDGILQSIGSSMVRRPRF